MIPGLGEAADGINALWYLGEGDHTNAALSAAGMVPFVGWFSVGGRWVRRALSADELARVGRLADSGTDLRHFLPGGRLGTGAAMRDPASFTPDQFLSSGELRRLHDRPWLQRMMAGNRFDSYMAPNYPHNQVYVVNPNGGYFRLDSYVPGEAIVSRKLTQLGEVSPQTARGYIDELLDKYPDGGVIADVPSTRHPVSPGTPSAAT